MAFQFTRKGVINVKADSDSDAQLLTILDAGAEDAQVEEDEMIVYTDMKDLHTVKEALQSSGMRVQDAGLQFVATTTVQPESQDVEDKLMRLLDALDELDDVTNIYHNAQSA